MGAIGSAIAPHVANAVLPPPLHLLAFPKDLEDDTIFMARFSSYETLSFEERAGFEVVETGNFEFQAVWGTLAQGVNHSVAEHNVFTVLAVKKYVALTTTKNHRTEGTTAGELPQEPSLLFGNGAIHAFTPSRDVCLFQQDYPIIPHGSIKLRVTLPYNPSMPLNQYLYIVSCKMNTERARAREWFLVAAVSDRQTVDFPIAITTMSVERKKIYFMTRGEAVAQRLYDEAGAIMEESGVGADDVAFSRPVRQCDHEPHPKPNVRGNFSCVRCGRFLGKLSWPSAA